ncbi:hypothetical protein Prudu_012844, partial [Prunus dulcis]
SAAKRVSRHGVDPNRSCNEEDMATARPPQAEPISDEGTVGSASLSPTRPDRPLPRGRLELVGKSRFPTEVHRFQFKLPARFSRSILHQIDRAPEVRSTRSRDLRMVKLAWTICRRSAWDPPPGHSKLQRHHGRLCRNFGRSTRGQTDPQEGPLRGPASSDQEYLDIKMLPSK